MKLTPPLINHIRLDKDFLLLTNQAGLPGHIEYPTDRRLLYHSYLDNDEVF